MSKATGKLRLFVAVYPPRELAESWAGRIKRMDLPAYRLTPIEQVHITVQFIGETPVKHLEQTIESVQRAAKGLESFALTAQELITLPERGRSRLIAVETDAPPTLLELKKRLATRLASNVRENPARKFRPHFTVCRFRSPAKVGPFERELPNDAFLVDRVRLMKSVLKPSGAEHETVETYELK